MATARSFEDMEVWKSARKLTKDIYLLTQTGPLGRDFALRDQVRRAAVSVVSNIAEGFERSGNAEFIRFLNIAKGSAGEIRAQIYLALDLEYLTEKEFGALSNQITSISRQISALTAYLQTYQSNVELTSRTRRTGAVRKPSTFNL